MVAIVTVVNGRETSHLRVYPAGAVRPNTSSINFGGDVVLGNLTFSALSGNRQIEIFNTSGQVHVVVDVVGWFL